MCSNEYIDFYVGEKRELEGYATPKTAGETVVIAYAKYEITEEHCDEVIMSGNCETDGNKFRTLLTFAKVGIYIFTITLYIGEEELKEKALIRVSR